MKEKLKTEAGCRELVAEFGRRPKIIAKALGLKSHSYVIHQLKKFGINENFENITLSFPDKKIPASLDVFKELVRLKSQVEEIKSRSVYQDNGRATVEIKSDKPVIILPTSDWHIGGNLAVEQFLDFIQLALSTPYIYLLLVGDYCDNFLSAKFQGEIIREIFPPQLQQELMFGVFDLLEERIVGAIPGNHDLFIKKALGFIDESRLKKYRFPIYRNLIGSLSVKLGNQEYSILAAHKYRFNSSFNLTHTVKQMFKNHSPFDVGIVGHHHEAAVETSKIHQKDVICIRTGSFKVDDDHATDEGYLSNYNEMPCCILFPDEHRIIGEFKLRDAIDRMKIYWKED